MIEALVVGGGPAGTSAAIGLAQSGCSVKLIEQRPIWSGRVCGSFLSLEASLQLERLNLIPFIKGNAIAVPDTVMTTPSGAQKRISIRHKNRPGLALSRQILESTLLKAAERTGIEIQTGCRLISHEKSGNGWNVVVQEDHTRNLKHVDLLILADGRYSMGHLKSGQDENGWFGFNAPFENVNQAPGEQSLHFFPGGYVGVLTFADGVSNLCGLIRRPFEEKISWDNIYQRVQKKSSPLRKLVESAQRIGEWRGVGPLPFGVHIEEGNGPLLAGDSAAVADPFMGEGIGRALSSGPMIAAAFRTLRSRNLPLSELTGLYTALWKKTYLKRWRFNRVMRFVVSHPASFPILEGLIRMGPLLKRLTPFFHHGFDSTPAHELP